MDERECPALIVDLRDEPMQVDLSADPLGEDLSAIPWGVDLDSLGEMSVDLKQNALEVNLCWPSIHVELVGSDGEFVTSDGEYVYVVLDD